LKQKDLITKTHRHIAWLIVSTASPEHYMITPILVGYLETFLLFSRKF